MSKTRKPLSQKLTRRSLMGWLATGAGTIGMGAGTQASAAPVVDPALRDAALRGLALAEHRGDSVSAKAAERALVSLSQTDPEGALLLRIYRKLDVRPAAYYKIYDEADEAKGADLELLHKAIQGCQPVRFGYEDLSGNETERTVLPLAIVHPPQGVKLLAFCLERQGYRQFFVRTMWGLVRESGNFAGDRLAMLAELVEKEGA